MADHPDIAAAKIRLREMVPGAVDVLEELLTSEHAGIRLSATREVLDRGGVPAKAEVSIAIDLTMDEEIEGLLRGLKRNQDRDELKADYEVEDAEIVEEVFLSSEPVLSLPGVLPGTATPPEEVPPVDPLDDVYWQANP